MIRFSASLLLALCLGFGIGLSYAWVVAPRHVGDVTPNALRSDFKDKYRLAIAAAYTATGNLDRARARLSLLGDVDSASALSAQAQRSVAAGQQPQGAEDLARLASDLSTGLSSIPEPSHVNAVSAEPISPTLGAPSMTVLPQPLTATPGAGLGPVATNVQTPIISPSVTPVPTSSAPFVLLSQDPVCSTTLTPGLLQITVLDHNRQPMPGIEITITWDTGEEDIFTGLKPEISAGYADFVMQPGTAYSLLVARSGSPVSGLTSPTCPTSGSQSYPGGLKLSFRQP